MHRFAWVVALCLLPAVASADVPTPGQRPVPYKLVAEGMEAFPDRVLLAFPWTLSGGAPTEEHAIIDANGTEFGRRSDRAKLWVAKKADYDEWKKTYKPSEVRHEDPALREFFASKKVVLCNLAPNVDTLVPEENNVKEIRERMRAVKLSDTECVLEKVAEAPNAKAAVVTPENVPKKSGCAGCTVGSESGGWGFAIALAVALGLRRGRAHRFFA